LVVLAPVAAAAGFATNMVLSLAKVKIATVGLGVTK